MLGVVFKLDPNETFPRLAHAPIVEAVIHWQARAQRELDPESLPKVLAERLPLYGKCEPLQQMEFTAMVSSKEQEPTVRHSKAWHGYRLTSEVGRQIVQFKRDGVVFSQSRPYDHWEPFAESAKQAWQVFRDLAAPLEIQRLGVRFINQFTEATTATLDRFLREPPTCPSNLPLNEFVYQSTFSVPEHPFDVRVIKIMQPSLPGLPQSSGLFLDCDVFTSRPLENESDLEDALLKMRWLKNKIFFTLLTEEAIRSLQ